MQKFQKEYSLKVQSKHKTRLRYDIKSGIIMLLLLLLSHFSHVRL